MSFIVLGSGVWFGYEFTTYLIRNNLSFANRIAIGIVLGMTIQTFIFFLTSLYFPLTMIHSITIGIICSILSFFLSFHNSRSHISTLIKICPLDFIIVIPCFLLLVYGVLVENLEDNQFTRGPAFADLPFHMNIISSFLYGVNYKRKSLFDVWSCFQSNLTLAYPMFHNFYISCLAVIGDFQLGTYLQITAFLLSISFIILLKNVFFAFSNNQIVSCISVIVWFFLGGLGWTMIFYPSLFQQERNNWILRFSDSINAAWMQPLVHYLLPQRSALFAMPLCLSILLCFLSAFPDLKNPKSFSSFFNEISKSSNINSNNYNENIYDNRFIEVNNDLEPFNENSDDNSDIFSDKLKQNTFDLSHNKIRFFILSGICTGLLPQLQVHSFVAIIQFTAIIFLIHFIIFFNKKAFVSIKSLLFYLFIYEIFSWVIGLPLIIPFIRRTLETDNFIKFNPFWNDNVYGKMTIPIIEIWWKSLGPFGYCALLFAWVAASKWQLIFWAGSSFVWLTTMFIQYQPWSMDNLKLLFAVWLPFAVPYVVQFYLFVWKKGNKFMKIIIYILMVQNTLSSILCFHEELFLKLILVHQDDQNVGLWISENTPIESIFLSYSSRFNPASSLAGRQLYHGLINWVIQHGVSDNRDEKTRELLTQKNNITLFKHEKISYILLNIYNDLEFHLSSNNNAWETIYNDHVYSIYKLKLSSPESSLINTIDHINKTESFIELIKKFVENIK